MERCQEEDDARSEAVVAIEGLEEEETEEEVEVEEEEEEEEEEGRIEMRPIDLEFGGSFSGWALDTNL